VICITHTISDSIGDFLSVNKPDKIFILCDATTRSVCLPEISIDTPFQIIEIAEGESGKNLLTCENVWKELALGGASRQSLLLCLGGGSITDLGGFVASTYQRGIKVGYIPTTLLCMVDAGIGGKTGINLGALKNYIGTFREIMQKGFPEKTNTEEWSDWINGNIHYKDSITSADFTENNIRAILNFGHTAAHALEYLYLSNGRELPHGQAVAAGMLIETMAASRLQICQDGLLQDIRSCISKNFEPVVYHKEDIAELNNAAAKDKKSMSGAIVCSVIADSGKPCEPTIIPEVIMTQAWLQYLNETA
jgi:3-dehydroquinate synthase